MGIFPTPEPFTAVKVGIASGGGGVYVERRVGAAVTMNLAASVGSIVIVYKGVGVGGGSTIGKLVLGGSMRM